MTTHHTDEKKPARGGSLPAQNLAAATGEELDVKIAKIVFGVDGEATKEWPWGVPPFSIDRNWSAAVIGRMLVHHAADKFNSALERRALIWGWEKIERSINIPALIIVLTPDEICNAALEAIQEFHSEE